MNLNQTNNNSGDVNNVITGVHTFSCYRCLKRTTRSELEWSGLWGRCDECSLKAREAVRWWAESVMKEKGLADWRVKPPQHRLSWLNELVGSVSYAPGYGLLHFGLDPVAPGLSLEPYFEALKDIVPYPPVARPGSWSDYDLEPEAEWAGLVLHYIEYRHFLSLHSQRK